VLVAVTTRKKRTPVEQDLIWSCLVTFFFYIFFRNAQTNGWGYRYIYAVLGNFVLLSLFGWQELRILVGAGKSLLALVGSLAIAVLVQLPLRCIQAERFVRPYYVSFQYMKSLPVSFVLLDATTVWSAVDLTRNDPFLRTTPKVVFSKRTTPKHLDMLKGHGDVQEVGGETLMRFGLPEVHSKE
jgi:hypothetical protein